MRWRKRRLVAGEGDPEIQARLFFSQAESRAVTGSSGVTPDPWREAL